MKRKDVLSKPYYYSARNTPKMSNKNARKCTKMVRNLAQRRSRIIHMIHNGRFIALQITKAAKCSEGLVANIRSIDGTLIENITTKIISLVTVALPAVQG
jgi:hypothetical protein